MCSETVELETSQLICLLAGGLIVLTGVTCALFLMARPYFQKRRAELPALGVLRARPLGFAHAVPVVALTGLFAILGAFQAQGGGGRVTPAGLVWSMALCTAAGLVTAIVCAALTGKGPRAVFGSAACPWGAAVGKGFFYGLAAVPVVMLASLAVTAAAQELDIDLAPQEVFSWLGDPDIPLSVRVTLMCFGVVAAPVSEELLFRGILLPALMKRRDFVFSVLLSSFYFSLIHLHGPSFLSLMLFSAMLSAGYAATGSILTPMVMHAVFNATMLVFFFAGPQDAEAAGAWLRLGLN